MWHRISILVFIDEINNMPKYGITFQFGLIMPISFEVSVASAAIPPSCTRPEVWLHVYFLCQEL